MSRIEAQVLVSGARGESFADVARRVGDFGGYPVPPGASDADVLGAFSDGVLATVEAAGYTIINPVDTAAAVGDGNFALSGEQTIGDVLTSTSRVLLMDQSDPAENGIWVTAAGAWARAADFDQTAEVVQGSLVPVIYGANAGSFILVTANPITVGTTGQEWRVRDYRSASKMPTTFGPLISVQDELNALGIPLTRFGALGTGTDDDLAALQDAADSGEPLIMIPPYFEFLIDGTLSLSSNDQQWRGVGLGSKIKLADGANVTAVTVTGDNVRLGGFDLNCNGGNQSAGGIGIYVNGADDTVIEDIEGYESYGNIILVNGGSGLRARRLKLHGGLTAGSQLMVVQNGANQFELNSVLVYDVPDADALVIGYGGTSCTQFQLNDCWALGDNSGLDATTYRSGIKIVRATNFQVNRPVAIAWKAGAGVICAPNTPGAVSCGRFSISNPLTLFNKDGVIADAKCFEFSIVNPIASDNVQDGIDINGEAAQWSILGGQCNRNGQKGVLIWGARNGLIKGTTFLNNNTTSTDPDDGAIEIRKDGAAGGTANASDIIVTECIGRDDRGGSATQAQFARVRDNASDIQFINNQSSGNKNQDILIETGPGGDPEDIFIENSGDTIVNTSAGDNIVVRHRLIDGPTKTIAAGVITITHRSHAIDTESAAASDDLVTVNGGTEQGQQCELRAANDAHTVVCKNGTGNLKLAGSDFSLDSQYDRLLLSWDVALDVWVELYRANNGA